MIDHYEQVVKKERLAKYLVCKEIKNKIENNDLMEEWKTHNILSSKFEKYYKQKIQEKQLRNEESLNNFLEYKIKLTSKILSSCELCEHKCKVNRIIGEKGFCKVGVYPYISSYFLHLGEERPLIPSGTIFFSGCTFRCAYNTHLIDVYT